MKKLAGILAVCILMSCVFAVSPAFAADKVVVGTQLQFQEGNGPIIINERLMLPLRAVSEALGATVYWFQDDKRVQLVLNDSLLSLQIGNNIMGSYKIIDGKAEAQPNIEMDVAAVIQNDHTYIPVRAVAEAFDAEIQWDNPNRTATIIKKEKNINYLTVAEASKKPENTLCNLIGVIGKDGSNDYFYIRSIMPNANGEYDRIYFCTPVKTSMSNDTSYADYIKAYWTEQFGKEDPSGTVVDFSGVITLIEDSPYLVVNKTTTGIRPLGTLNEYLRSLGLGN